MKDPKLIMTILARDEGDIIEKNIEFHLNHGVDFIIATDNASSDNTRNVFVKYQNQGKLYLIDEPGRDISQSKWNNKMARIAIDNYKADIVFHCDADEFWFPKSGDLKAEIWNSSADVLKVNLINILLENKGGKESFPENAKYAVVHPIETENFQEDSKKENLYFFRYPPKVIFKTGEGLLKVSMGNHSIINKKKVINTRKSENINIFHFPLREKKEFYRKVINYGRAMERNNSFSKDINWHIRRWFDAYKLGKLDEEYSKLLISKEKAMEMQRIGIIESFDFQNFINKSKNKDWKYFVPVFEYEKEFQDISWPWAGHKLFSYDLIRNIKPKKIVELGTHKGTSFFSFCQAVKDEGIKTEINAIDTWEGDKHAGFYGDDIYKFVQKVVNKLYSGVEIKLIKKTFDNAISEFKDKSIDILHIDGLHTYEAVKHDFENWLIKIKDSGIILFHDIKVGESGFGVCKLWEELKQEYQTIEFHHSFGLGVLFKSKNDVCKKLIKMQEELQMHYYYIYESIKNNKINNNEDLIKCKNIKIEQKDNEIKNRENEIKNRDEYIKNLNQEIYTLKNTLRWKIPNYFYKIYKKQIKKFIPKFLFKFIKLPLIFFKYKKNKHSYNNIISKDKKNILFIDLTLPTYDKDAGSYIAYKYLLILVKLGYNVIFCSYNENHLEPYNTILTNLGIKVIYGPSAFLNFIKINGEYINYTFLSRPLIANEFFNIIKKYSNTKILYIGVDLHFLREQRMSEIMNKNLEKKDQTMQKKEFSIMRKADISLFYSKEEIKIIDKIDSNIKTATLPWIQPVMENNILDKYQQRKNIIFLGGFSHAPNIDAVIWFHDEIFPVLKNKIKNFKVVIVGSNVPKEIEKLNERQFKITGFVEENKLPELFSESKVFIAPLRFGAGFKGKIAKAMSFGVPVVTTSIGAEGIGLIDGRNACLADDKKVFAKKVVNLYHDKLLWEKISKESVKHVQKEFSTENAKKVLKELLK